MLISIVVLLLWPDSSPEHLHLPAMLILLRRKNALESPTIGLIDVLTSMYNSCIVMHMRSTLNIDDDLVEKATKLTGITVKTSLVRMGLEALIAKESARRLAELGASEPKLNPIRRRRKTT